MQINRLFITKNTEYRHTSGSPLLAAESGHYESK